MSKLSTKKVIKKTKRVLKAIPSILGMSAKQNIFKLKKSTDLLNKRILEKGMRARRKKR